MSPAGLEDRLLLDTRTWTGGALLNDRWSDKDNWSGRVVPKAGDDIVFPIGIGTLDRGTNMDITGGSFRSITFLDNDYKVTGKAFTITGNITQSGTSGINEIVNDFTFSTAAHTINISSGQLTFSGSLKGVRSQGVGSVTKTGGGRVVFSGATANSLVQDLVINHGEVVMNKSNSVTAFAGLSITVAGTAISDRPKLDVFQSNAFNLQPSIKIQTFPGAAAPAEMIIDSGDVVRTGPLTLLGGLISGAGTLQLAGDVTVNFSPGVTVDSVITGGVVNLGSNIRNITVASGAKLEIQSAIEELSGFGPGNQGFRKWGDGGLEFSRPSDQRPNTYKGQTVILDGTLIIDTVNSITPVTLIPGDMTIGSSGSTTLAQFSSIVPQSIAKTSRVQVQGAGRFNDRQDVVQQLDVQDQGVVTNFQPSVNDRLQVTGLATFKGNSNIGEVGVASRYQFHQLRIENKSLVVPGGSAILQTDDLTLIGAQLEVPSDVNSALDISGTIHVLSSPISSTIKGRMKSTASFITMDVADGAALDDLVIDAIIMKGNASDFFIDQKFTKLGTGTMAVNNRLVPDNSGVNAPTSTELDVRAGTVISTGFATFFVSTFPTSTVTLAGTSLVTTTAGNNTVIAPGIRGTGIFKYRGGATLRGTASKLQIELNGLVPGTEHDQLQVEHFETGHSGLTDAPVLEVLVGFSTSLNQVFKVVDITDPTDTNFRRFRSPAGVLLDEGSVFTAGGVSFQISYVGGDGNDITIKRVSTPPAFQNRTLTPHLIEGGIATLSGLITEPDVEDTFFLDVDWGDGSSETFTFAPGTSRQVAVSHRYLNDAPTYSPVDTYSVRLAWHDEHGGTNSATLQTQVQNVTPEVSNLHFELPPTVGQPSVLRGSLFDPGPNDVPRLLVDWGDGSGLQTIVLAPGASTFALTHAFLAPGKYRVSVQPADERASGRKTTLRITVLA